MKAFFSFLVLLVLAFGLYKAYQSPEYAMAQALMAAQNRDFGKFNEYVGVEEMVDAQLKRTQVKLFHSAEEAKTPWQWAMAKAGQGLVSAVKPLVTWQVTGKVHNQIETKGLTLPPIDNWPRFLWDTARFIATGDCSQATLRRRDIQGETAHYQVFLKQPQKEVSMDLARHHGHWRLVDVSGW